MPPSELNTAQLEQLLQKHFGFAEFRGSQKEALSAIFAGKSVLALMPTGTGKSLLYQYPAKVREGLVLVVSPLISLMHEQAQKAQELGISSTYLASTLSFEERQKRLQGVSEGRYQLIFVTPERLQKPEFREVIEKLPQTASSSAKKIQLLAVDEAHCISQWGHNFRPDYSKLGEIREWLGNPVTVALTATATEEVQTDILQSLRIPSSPILKSGVERPNLQIEVQDVYGADEKIRNLVGLIHQSGGSKIIYFSLIQTLRKVAGELGRMGIESLTYHGDLPADIRKKNQARFLKEENALMLATPAFGLGIDKPNVRLLVHFEIPGSLEAYYQEIGRAGRDGLNSQCVLFWDQDDVSIQGEFLRWAYPEAEYIQKTFEMISKQYLRFQSEGLDFIREQLSYKNRRDFRPEAAFGILKRWGCLEEVDGDVRVLREPTSEDYQSEDSQKLLKQQQKKLLQIVQWIDNGECRLQSIYEYFGVTGPKCGHCDNCRRELM